MPNQQKTAEIAKKFPRVHAWNAAKEMVDPIVEQYGLETYQAGAIFAPSFKSTPVDQHIDHIIHVAEWLMETNDE